MNCTSLIVGGGASGALVLLGLLQKSEKQHIVIVHQDPTFGPGMAYSLSSPQEWLLNVRAQGMSLYESDPDHFCQWLKKNGFSYGARDFVPRFIYGRYIVESVTEALAGNKHHRVEFVQDVALEAQVESKRLTVRTAQGVEIVSYHLFLATGNEPSQSWNCSTDFLDQIKSFTGQKVLIVGSGLTALDALVSLSQLSPRQIQIVSRHGLLPHRHSDTASSVKVELREILSTSSVRRISSILRRLPWLEAIDQIRPHTQGLWKQLPDKEKKRFFRHLISYWNISRHRAPGEHFEIAQKMLNSKSTELITGRVHQIAKQDTGFRVSVQRRGFDLKEEMEFDHVLNCVGPGSLKETRNPLLLSLLRQKAVVVDSLGWGLKTDGDGHCFNAEGSLGCVSAVGVLLRGTLFEITAIPDIRAQVGRLMGRLL